MSTSNAALTSFVQRIEALEEEKREIAAQIAEVKGEAKSAGFDVKVINALVRERRMSAHDRREFLELLEIYRAAIGDLDGTPLGDYARQRLMGKPASTGEEPGDEDEPKAAPPATSGAEPAASEPPEPPVDLAKVRSEGADAAHAGRKVVENPYPYGDPQRAAWDEGFCEALGNDGMEIPEAWRRAKKPKKGGGE